MLTFTLRILNQIIQGTLNPPKISIKNKAINIPFRCWPIDLDVFLHMNNANYLKNAELARWRTFPIESLISNFTSKEGMVFLAVENKVQYLKPIGPFERYNISTSCYVNDKDDKWIYYRHVFEQHPLDVAVVPEKSMFFSKGSSSDDRSENSNTPIKFAVVDVKAVVKQRNGMTIKPSILIGKSDFYRKFITARLP